MLRTVLAVFTLLCSLAATVSPSNAADIEKPAAVDGTAYAVIAPIFNDPAASQSYIRLFNGGASTANITVTVIGSPSGRTYGTATVAVPANASPQYAITLLLQLANAAALNGGDDQYALYLQSPEAKAGYQHVTFNAQTTLFQNASVCSSLINEVMGISSGRVLTNVHTSRLAAYPSSISIHNYRNVPVMYRLTVIDAGAVSFVGAISPGAGAIIGSQDVVVGANTTYTKPFSFFETALSWTPTSYQYHANIIVTNPSGNTSYELISQAIINQTQGGQLDMSIVCAINPVVPAPATAATTFAGTIAGANGQSGRLSVTVQTSLAAAVSAPLLTAQSTAEKAQAVSQATGTLVTGGSTVSLSGTYDSTTTAISLGGGGYTFTGTIANGILSGSYMGPNNASGGFSSLNATTAPVTRYCGTFTENAQAGSGVFNVEVSANGVLSGNSIGTSGDARPSVLTGQVTGSTFSATSTTAVDRQTITGTIQNGTISGTFPGGSISGTSCS